MEVRQSASRVGVSLTPTTAVVGLSTVLSLAVACVVVAQLPLFHAFASADYRCESLLKFSHVVETRRKGLAIDDGTFSECAERIPHLWPNTDMPVTSLRLFKAWDSAWPADRAMHAWKAIADFATRFGAKVLVGTQISCNEAEDDRDWANVLQLLRLLGPERVMGVAVGNELELLQFKDKRLVPDACVERVWGGGYFVRKFDQRVLDLDMLGGFEDVPVTSVFSATIASEYPFCNVSKAPVLAFFQHVIRRYGARWVYSVNVYPYFDPSNQLDPGSPHCAGALQRSLCWNDADHCLLAGITKSLRERMQAMGSNDVLWVTETGWSSPMAGTLRDKPIGVCAEFSSEASFRQYYEGFLSWDLTTSGVRGADHIFYFTPRDSNNFGVGENFGLISSCGDSACKLQAPQLGAGDAAALALEAACEKNLDCETLDGACCPTLQGEMLICCGVNKTVMLA